MEQIDPVLFPDLSPEEMLRALGVWPAVAEWCERSLPLTPEWVRKVAEGVARDDAAGNKPRCLVERLAIQCGLRVPQSTKAAQRAAQREAVRDEAVADLVALRDRFMAREAVPQRGPTAEELAKLDRVREAWSKA